MPVVCVPTTMCDVLLLRHLDAVCVARTALPLGPGVRMGDPMYVLACSRFVHCSE